MANKASLRMDTDNETWYLIDNLLVMLLWNAHLGLLLKALLIILHSTLKASLKDTFCVEPFSNPSFEGSQFNLL